MLTYTFRLYPTKAQEALLLDLLEKCRLLYNGCLQERRDGYKKGVKVNHKTQEKALTEIKNTNPEYSEIHTHILQDVTTRIDKAFQNFFRRVKIGDTPGYPRFRSYGMYNSFKLKDLKNKNGFSIVAGGKRIKVSGIGKIKVKMHRAMEGAMRQAIIKLDSDNHWYVKIVCERLEKPQKIKNFAKPIGLDIGIKTLVACSDGTTFENIKPLKQLEDKLAKAQQALSRKERGSNRRRKQKEIISKIHNKIKNIREDYLHKVSRTIVNSYDFIALENLNLKKMIETGGKSLAKGICDIAAGSFLIKVLYKAENAGIMCLLVDPRNTSKKCSCCGNIKENLKLSDRIYKCENCGLVIDRDLNASINIVSLAVKDFRARADPAQIPICSKPLLSAL